MKFENPSINPAERSPVPQKEKRFIPSRESITALEDVVSIGIGWGGKLETFLAACELKPASHISVFVRDSQDQKNIEEIFRNLKLEYLVAKQELTDPADNEEQGIYLDYIVSHSLEGLARAKEAYLNLFQEATADESAFGLAMGYPQTAVEAFTQVRNSDTPELSNRELLLSNKEKETFLTPEENAFTQFKLSRQYWQSEIEWVHDIIEITKEHAPKIYAENLKSN